MKCGEFGTQHAGEEKGSDWEQLDTISGLPGTDLALGRPLSGAVLPQDPGLAPPGETIRAGPPLSGPWAFWGWAGSSPTAVPRGTTAQLAGPQHKKRSARGGLQGPCGRQSPTFGGVGTRGPESALGSSSVRFTA